MSSRPRPYQQGEKVQYIILGRRSGYSDNCTVLDLFYNEIVTQHKPKKGWYLLLCTGVEYGETLTVEKHQSQIRKV
jgi:hypothetical protein